MRLVDIEDISLLKTIAVGRLSAKAVWRLIKAQPTVDAVPVIRCKDCKYHHEAHYEEDGEDPIIKHKCKLLKGYQFSENHYCGFAERKEE